MLANEDDTLAAAAVPRFLYGLVDLARKREGMNQWKMGMLCFFRFSVLCRTIDYIGCSRNNVYQSEICNLDLFFGLRKWLFTNPLGTNSKNFEAVI